MIEVWNRTWLEPSQMTMGLVAQTLGEGRRIERRGGLRTEPRGEPMFRRQAEEGKPEGRSSLTERMDRSGGDRRRRKACRLATKRTLLSLREGREARAGQQGGAQEVQRQKVVED